METHVYVGFPEKVEARRTFSRNLAACFPTDQSIMNRSNVLENTAMMLKKISSHKRAEQLSAADLKSVITSAYLQAVNEFAIRHTGSNREVTSSHNEDNNVATLDITEKHLWDAFFATRSSVSEEEMEFYDSINAPFQKEKLKS